MMKKTLITLLLAWGFSASLLMAQTDQELVQTTVQPRTIKGHIHFLASDELAGRDTPSEGLQIAAKYLATSLMRYGVDTVPGAEGYFQPVGMKAVKPSSGKLTMMGRTFTAPGNALVMGEGSGQVSGDIVFVDFGTAADFKKAKLEGKIVLARIGDGETDEPRALFAESREKRKRAKEAGAAALIEFYNSPKMAWSFWKYYLGQVQVVLDEGEEEENATSQSEMPHLWLDDMKNELALAAEKAKGQGNLTVSDRNIEKFNTYNVVGMVEGTDPKLKDEFVIYSAHYDHVGIGRPDAKGDTIYNGSRDNAVGTVTVLSAAENIAKHPTKRSALFILFTGEEKGLLGSKWYVDHPLIPLEKMAYCFNSDNGGYNDTSIATIIGLDRTTAKSHIKQACETFGLGAIEDPAPEQGLFDRSDNVNFAKKGIPSPTFSLGFQAFDEEIMRYYHQPSDGPETLDYDYLNKFFKAYVYACRLIANDPEKPFWVEGDKYYEAGKGLYGE